MNVEQLELALRKEKAKLADAKTKSQETKQKGLAIIGDIEASVASLSFSDELLAVKEAEQKALSSTGEQLESEIKQLEESISNLETELGNKKQNVVANINNKKERSDIKMENKLPKLVQQFYTETLTQGAVLPEQLRQQYEGGVTTTGNELVVKESKYYKHLPNEVVDLSTFFAKQPVDSETGSFLFNPNMDIVLEEVGQLQPTPVVDVNKFEEVTFKIKEYAGLIPISNMLLKVGEQSVAAVEFWLAQLALGAVNTKNKAFATAIKTFTPKTITDFDGIKTLINTGIKTQFKKVFIVTQSFFADLDNAKDSSGKYIISEDNTKETGKAVKGVTLVVVNDELLGNTGDKVGFFGASTSLILCDMGETSTKWVDNRYRGKVADQVVAFDLKKILADQGYFITLDLQTPDVVSE